MAKKSSLEQRIGVAYFKATGQTNGWEVFLDMVFKNTQEEIAHTFGVAFSTVNAWHKEFKASRATV